MVRLITNTFLKYPVLNPPFPRIAVNQVQQEQQQGVCAVKIGQPHLRTTVAWTRTGVAAP